MKINKKLIFTTIIEVLFTIVLIILLIYVRHKAVNYVDQVQAISQDIGTLQQDLQTQNLTSYDKSQVQSTITNMNSLLDKGLFLVKVVLPISLLLLSLIFYFLIWRISSKVSILRFIYSAIIPLVSFLVLVYFILNYIAYYFGFVDNPGLLWLIVSFVVLILTYYVSLFLLIINKPFMKTLVIAKKSIKKVILHFVINLLTNAFYFILLFWLFFLTYAGGSIILASILLFGLLIIINIQRVNLVNRLSKLN